MASDVGPNAIRDIGLDELPVYARSLAKLGLRQGFTVRCVHADWNGAYSDSVRLVRDDSRYYAVWINGRFDNAGAPWEPLKLTELRKRVAA